jgi:hypothetical protein
MRLPELTPKRRRRLYDVGCAALVVAGTYGLVSGQEADAWMYLLAGVLNVARRNVNDEQ